MLSQKGWFAVIVASLGTAALASCSSGPGGIVVEPDGAGGAKDAANDAREAGGSSMAGAGGAAGAMSDSATDTTVSDASDDRSGDSGSPPLCVFHTEPPPMLFSLDDSGADVTTDAIGDVDGAIIIDAGPADTGSTDTGSPPDDVVIVDSGGTQDTSSPDAPTSDASTVDAVADAGTTTDASGDRSGGRDGGGDGGDAGPPPSITVLNSPFLGPYLADSTGRTLYTFGNDKPGDCMYDPIPDCEADCAIAWPPFDAGKRTLAMGLDPNVFGSVLRTDGMAQVTTYYGWPLYYYRSDTASGVINGHAKSKTWHVATVTPFNMMIMKDKTNPRYIADGDGRTLYVFDKDTAGTAGSDPVSACAGDCLTQYPPFVRNRINAVSSLNPNDLVLFVRPDNGRQQVAYKGAPLYLSAADMRSGDQKGVAMGWTVAAAP
jgi:predicted lipoprotein with Yx(FWY)xxD motif